MYISVHTWFAAFGYMLFTGILITLQIAERWRIEAAIPFLALNITSFLKELYRLSLHASWLINTWIMYSSILSYEYSAISLNVCQLVYKCALDESSTTVLTLSSMWFSSFPKNTKEKYLNRQFPPPTVSIGISYGFASSGINLIEMVSLWRSSVQVWSDVGNWRPVWYPWIFCVVWIKSSHDLVFSRLAWVSL